MSIRTKLLFGFAFCAMAIVVMFCLSWQNTQRVLDSRKWVEHTEQVLERLEVVLSLLKDTESGSRGYALTGQEEMLDSYETALSKLPNSIENLRTLTADNPRQQTRLARLEELTSLKTNFCKKVIDAYRDEGQAASAKLSASLVGKRAMDDARRVVAEMDNEERELLSQRITAAYGTSATVFWLSGAAALTLLLSVGWVAFALISSVSKSLETLIENMEAVGRGQFAQLRFLPDKDELGQIGRAQLEMADKLRASTEASASQSWLISNLAALTQSLQSETEVQQAAQVVLNQFASATASRHGMFYLYGEHAGSVDNSRGDLNLIASYAHGEAPDAPTRIAVGQGLVGQCAKDKARILVLEVPENYARITSGIGEAAPTNVVLLPVLYQGQLRAVIEQSSLHTFTPMQLEFFDQSAANLGVLINNIASMQRTQRLLAQEQQLTEELQVQHEELTESNKQLEKLTMSLQLSEEELKQQQEELQQINEELEERSHIQARQNIELETKNLELEQLRLAVEERAEQVARSSKYKTEFLANMSHELRTPLNSLLILSRVLYENTDGNLTDKQVEFAHTIYSAGSDLLALIDDVLDISKVEAGAMSVDIAEEPLKNLCDDALSNFREMAKQKSIQLVLEMKDGLPRLLKTDGRRVLQILRNLLSNALKFTEKGSVKLIVSPADLGLKSAIAFTVADTGIGIPKNKQDIIFQAFQQAEGALNRKYKGTGLGLAISREFAELLGGEIKLVSKEGEGSSFTLYLPSAVEETEPAAAPETDAVHDEHAESKSNGEFSDDRSQIRSGDKVVLTFGSDTALLKQIFSLAHDRDFKVLHTGQGKKALALVHKYSPDAITLDVTDLDREGWSFLDCLKRDIATRHIPVHIICPPERMQQARRLGVIGYSTKPASLQTLTEMVNRFFQFANRTDRHLLIVEDDEEERKRIEDLIGGSDVLITCAANGEEAISAIKTTRFDCMILDLGLPDMSGFKLLEKLRTEDNARELSVIVHTARSLTSREETELRRTVEAIIVKGENSAERLLDETTLFLHRIEKNLPEQKRQMLKRLHLKDPVLSGKNALIVDDDVRHIFAVTSMLEQYGMNVSYAESGNEAVRLLETRTDVQVILMDVMMPGMDGFETMKAIRLMPHCKNVPIIALTAKAMKGDREQCIEAGASDYLSKPVDSAQLASLMRVWLY
ncbi:MAG: response regulator [Candidatus Obscuribacterales bacterium]